MALWQIRQLEKLREIEPELVDHALGRLLDEEGEVREKLVVGAYLDGDINLGKAAELLGVPALELRQRFRAQGIPVRVGAESIEALQAEVAAAEQWKRALAISGRFRSGLRDLAERHDDYWADS